MKSSNRIAVLLLSCLQLAAPTMARGDDAREAVPARMETIRSNLHRDLPAASPLAASPSTVDSVSFSRAREKLLSLAEFSESFHNAKITYNDTSGEVIFSGTTSPSCMDHFSFSRGDASSEVAVKFRYLDVADRDHCLNKENIKCETEDCVGLRSKEGSKIKLGKESGELRMIYKDPYNQDEVAGDLISVGSKAIYHKGELELAKERADLADKEKADKIEKSKKVLASNCTSCNVSEQGIANRRDALAALVEIGEFTDEQAEKETIKSNRFEMTRLTNELKKARLRKLDEDSSSEVEELKEKIASLANEGSDPELSHMAKKAYFEIVGRKLKDINVDPATASANALAELQEIENLDLSDEELAEFNQIKNNLEVRQGCLTRTINNPNACSQVFAQVRQERTPAQPAMNPMANPANGNFQNTQPAMAAPASNGINSPTINPVMIPSGASLFGSYQVPNGGAQFKPNGQQPSNFGLINSGYQLQPGAPLVPAGANGFQPR